MPTKSKTKTAQIESKRKVYNEAKRAYHAAGKALGKLTKKKPRRSSKAR